MLLKIPIDKILKQFYSTTAKTHKFKDIKQIKIDDLKLRPIIYQTGTQLCARACQAGGGVEGCNPFTIF